MKKSILISAAAIMMAAACQAKWKAAVEKHQLPWTHVKNEGKK